MFPLRLYATSPATGYSIVLWPPVAPSRFSPSSAVSFCGTPTSGNLTNLLGQMLYYILTTRAGQQTLGEEYCDVTKVAGLHAVDRSQDQLVDLTFINFASYELLLYIAERLKRLDISYCFGEFYDGWTEVR
ncbi:hypothetical protein LXL04_033666 [Taraxacum kok-saghyz]